MSELERDPTPLGRFLKAEIEKRRISIREFARRADISHSTISDHLNGIAGEPTLDFLRRVSTYTGIDICTLISLIIPGSAQSGPSPETIVLAKQLQQLPDEMLAIVKRLIGQI